MGIDNPVCDGTWPVGKQSTDLQRANYERNRILAFIVCKEIQQLKRQIKTESLMDDEQRTLQSKLVKKESSCLSKEVQSGGYIPQDFAALLEEELNNSFDAHSLNSAGGFVDHVIKAEFQADSVIIGRVVMQETWMVMSSDVDMPVMAGNHCIGIKEFTGKSHTIVSTCHDTLLQAFGLLFMNQSNFVQYQMPNTQFLSHFHVTRNGR